MLQLMPPKSANPSLGTPAPAPAINPLADSSYWYGSSSLPDALDALPQDTPNPRMMRRASEAVIHAAGFQSQDGHLQLDTSQATLVIRPQPGSAAALSKAPLAPKQGLGGALANARGQHQSPISGTYALRTPRGKITSIACESCRKRKSKCDGVRPKCNTCQSKNLVCVYDVAEDGKTTTQLRAHVRRLTKDVEEMRSLFHLVAVAPDRDAAVSWANEIEKHGFSHHSAEEIRQALSDNTRPGPILPDGESFGTPSSDHFPSVVPTLGNPSFTGSSRSDSREQSQPGLGFPSDNPIGGITPITPSPLDLNAASEALSKFGFDCAYFRNAKHELLTNGWREEDVFGRSEIDMDSLILGFNDPQDSQSVSTWCSRTVNKILPAASLPVRLASTWVLTKLLRYLIWPTVEHMNANPEWLLPPVNKQDSTPHDILIDLVPWPQVRQLLYQHPQEYPVGAMVGLIGIDWPYPPDACHYWDIEAAHTRMTPLFESTVADLNNWTIDPKILEMIPQLEGHIPLRTV